MNVINTLYENVNKKFRELQEYTDLYNKKTKHQREVILEEAKSKFKEDPEGFDIDSIGRDLLFVNGFHQTDIRKLQTALLENYKLYMELGGDQSFDEELIQAVEFLKSTTPKQFFTVEDSEFKEIEEGRLETAMKDFREKNYYKLFENQVKQLLSE